MEIESNSILDLLVVLPIKNRTNPIPAANVISENVINQFGKDVELKAYATCYVMQFTSKTKAAKALIDGLQVGNGLPVELYTMNQYLLQQV